MSARTRFPLTCFRCVHSGRVSPCKCSLDDGAITVATAPDQWASRFRSLAPRNASSQDSDVRRTLYRRRFPLPARTLPTPCQPVSWPLAKSRSFNASARRVYFERDRADSIPTAEATPALVGQMSWRYSSSPPCPHVSGRATNGQHRVSCHINSVLDRVNGVPAPCSLTVSCTPQQPPRDVEWCRQVFRDGVSCCVFV